MLHCEVSSLHNVIVNRSPAFTHLSGGFCFYVNIGGSRGLAIMRHSLRNPGVTISLTL